MNHRDPQTLELGQQTLAIAPDVMIWPVRERGQTVYRLEIPRLHRFFRVGYEEYVFISLLDGKTTAAQACGLAAAELGKDGPTEDESMAIARWLLRNRIAHFAGSPPPTRHHGKPARDHGMPDRSRGTSILTRWNPLWIKFPIPGIDRPIERVARSLTWTLSPIAVAASIVTMIVAALVLMSSRSQWAATAGGLLHPSNALLIAGVWVALKVVHELAHAIACVRMGGRIGPTGLVLMLLAPLAFIDVSSCWRLRSRRARIYVSAAGMFAELTIAAVAALAWAFVAESEQARFLLANVVVTAGLSTILFNANPLMRFDGYFILADAVDIANLYSEGSRSLRRCIGRLVGEKAGRDGLGEEFTIVGWRRGFVLVYGGAALLWRILVMTSLLIAASAMFAGAGWVLVLAVLVCWLSPPVQKHVRAWFSQWRDRPVAAYRRAAISIGFAGLFLLAVFVVPIRTRILAPGVVQYRSEATVRARASGFLSKIHVSDGQPVRAGDVLATLENRELTTRLSEQLLTLRQNAIRRNVAMERSEPGLVQVLAKRAESIADQIRQLETQAAGLTVLAPHDGTVVARNLDQAAGRYIEEGQILMAVAAPDDQEIVAMVSHRSVDEVRSLVDSRVSVRAADRQTVDTRFRRIEPRASDQLAIEAMAAINGGSLAIRPTEDEKSGQVWRLSEPHFRVRLALEDGSAPESLRDGMRVTASLGYRSATLAERLDSACRRWWQAERERR